MMWGWFTLAQGWLTADRWLNLLGLILAVGFFFDARRQRTRREKVVNEVRSVIGRVSGTLVTLKGNVDAGQHAAINDALEALTQLNVQLPDL